MPNATPPLNDLFICRFCKMTFTEKKLCICHEKTCDNFYVIPKKQGLKVKTKSCKSNQVLHRCTYCGKNFTTVKNRNRHENNCQLNPDSKVICLCAHCDFVTNSKDNIRIHLKKCAGRKSGVLMLDLEDEKRLQQAVLKTGKAKTPCLIPDCYQEFFHKVGLIDHLKTSHTEVDVREPLSFRFSSRKEFELWKDKEQLSTFSYFVQKSGKINAKLWYLYCQHDGSLEFKKKTNRCSAKGRIKVGHYCIAKMKVRLEPNGEMSVVYFPTHNHLCSPENLAHMRHSPAISKEQRVTITQQHAALKNNLSLLNDFLVTASLTPHALSHALSVTSDLLKHLESMTDENKEEIQTEPFLDRSLGQSFQTKTSQHNLAKKSLRLDKKKKEKAGSSQSNNHVMKDLLDALGSFTPPISYVSSPSDLFLKCGDTKVSLLDLKSLEMYMLDEELKACRNFDPYFKMGWISAPIVNAYLFSLQKDFPSCVALSSDFVVTAAKGQSVLHILEKKLFDKDIFLFPANVTGYNWCIAAVLLNTDKAQVLFYDPMQGEMDDTVNRFMCQIIEDMKCCFPNLTGWNEILYIEMRKQTDAVNCGIDICSFAEQTARKAQPYQLVHNVHEFRKSMYKQIVGDCLQRETHHALHKCPVCLDLNPTKTGEYKETVVFCSKCGQKYHRRCVGTIREVGDFVCQS